MGNDDSNSNAINYNANIRVPPVRIGFDPRFSKEVKKQLKDQLIDYSKNTMKNYNERKDWEFNARHPNTQGDIFDRFNNRLTNGLYYADNNLGTVLLGHSIATAGRITRNNYELNYERSPFTDNFERSFHAFTNATDLGL